MTLLSLHKPWFAALVLLVLPVGGCSCLLDYDYTVADGGPASDAQPPDAGPMCDPACAGGKPACALVGGMATCVECAQDTDCMDMSKPRCDTTQHKCAACEAAPECEPFSLYACVSSHCVACATDGDCMAHDATHPHCSATNTCVTCASDADCPDDAPVCKSDGSCGACTDDTACMARIDAQLCDMGTCVQCTVMDESACSGDSCDPATGTCTTTRLHSVPTCGQCVADSECTSTDDRCVDTMYGGTDQGGHCLRLQTASCTRPYTYALNAPSLSGEATENFCGFNQSKTTCEAIHALMNSQTCPGGTATECAADGALCENVATQLRCTYRCGIDADCPFGYVCGGSNYCDLMP